jgi:cytochrome c-type biogenesis protein
MEIILSKAFPAFLAGIVTFIAPCTLPLIPSYISFISGVSFKEIENNKSAKRKILFNSFFFLFGFSAIFILIGSLLGLVGQSFVDARIWLTRVSGIFLGIFGLYMLGLFDKLPNWFSLNFDQKLIKHIKKFEPGTPLSSFLFGVSFALGWSPCAGPILGSILFLASSSATVGQGAVLLAIFSLGFSVPFLIISTTITHSASYLKNADKYMKYVKIIGGLFLVFIGYLLITQQLARWVSIIFNFLQQTNYGAYIYDYL